MLELIDLHQVLVLDIETVAQHASFSDVPSHLQELWAHKIKNKLIEGETPADVYPRSALYAEFGQIICISAGVFHQIKGEIGFRIKSFVHQSESDLLADFSSLLQKQPSNLILCAHNGKGFDFPYICKRLLINGLPIPQQFQIIGKKPWEVNHLDTMELWRFGDFRNNTSLNLIAAAFGIPTPKDDISGEDVHRVYYEENNFERIRVYCEKDVITTAQILRKLRNEPLIGQNAISFAS